MNNHGSRKQGTRIHRHDSPKYSTMTISPRLPCNQDTPAGTKAFGVINFKNITPRIVTAILATNRLVLDTVPVTSSAKGEAASVSGGPTLLDADTATTPRRLDPAKAVYSGEVILTLGVIRYRRCRADAA